MWSKFRQWLADKEYYREPIVFSPIAFSVHDTDFLVRQVDVDDVESLLRVERLCYQGQTPWQRGTFVREINRQNHTLYLSVEKAGEMIAYCGGWFAGQEAHISNLAVVPTEQNKGIATRLIVWFAAVARAKHCHKLSLEVRKSNQVAQNLYQKLHFQIDGIKKDYYQDKYGVEDAVLMSMSLEAKEVKHEL